MKLYGSPGACSLAAHIALLEAGLEAQYVPVDLATHRARLARRRARRCVPKGW